MAVQFAGSSSTGNRRRRRLAANGDVAGIDTPQLDGEGTQFESQLVASEAACPWVPISETRIWIYSAALLVLLGALAFATIRSDLFPAQLSPLTVALFSGASPVAVTQTQILLLGLSAQLAALITWYRARCMLDFAGRYRVWPWAVGMCAIAAFCLATGSHRAIGEIVGNAALIPWRGPTVAWLLPLCVISLPLTLFLDRDTRKNPSSVWMLRISESLWLLEACLELYQPELRAQPWYASTYLLVPLFASAALFVGLWQHARVVAYICPDPPVLDEQSAWSLAISVCRWLGRRMVLRKRTSADAEDDDEKPKRRRKKGTTEEAAATKKKRKPAIKRASPSRTRTRVKSADEEEAVDDSSEVAEEQDLTSIDESEQVAADESTSWEEAEEQWEEEAVEEPPAPPSKSKGSNRVTQVHQAHPAAAPAPHARWEAEPEQEEAEAEEETTSSSYSDSNDEEDDGQSYQGDTEMTADQMRGLSKRQKRDLKKQQRDQERNRKR